MAVILLHVGEGVVLRGVAVGPGEHSVGLAERAGTLPLRKAGILASHDYIIHPTLSDGLSVRGLLESFVFCWVGAMVTV